MKLIDNANPEMLEYLKKDAEFTSESVRQLCMQSIKHAAKNKELIQTLKGWRFQACMAWLFFIITLATSLINQ